MYGALEVVNVRHCLRADVVYCGRAANGRKASPLANNFRMRDRSDAAREEAIQKFKQWFWQELHRDSPARREFLRIAARVKAGDTVRLGCWCAPYHCHCHAIAAAVHSYNAHPEKFPNMEVQ